MMISAQQYFSGRISDEMKFIFNYQRFDVFIVSFIWLELFYTTTFHFQVSFVGFHHALVL